MERNYTGRSDLWSAGCILAELMLFSDEMNGIGRDPPKRILFPGQSCFPVSPCQQLSASTATGTTKISENDQYIKIFERLGEVQERDFSFFTDDSAYEYTQQILSQVKGKKGFTISSQFMNCNEQFQEILQSLLEFNPYFRSSAKQILSNPFFDDIRKSSLE